MLMVRKRVSVVVVISSLDTHFNCSLIVLVQTVNTRWVTRRRDEAGHEMCATCFAAARERRDGTTTARTVTVERT